MGMATRPAPDARCREKKWCEPLIEFIDSELADYLPPLAVAPAPSGCCAKTCASVGLSKGEVTVSAAAATT